MFGTRQLEDLKLSQIIWNRRRSKTSTLSLTLMSGVHVFSLLQRCTEHKPNTTTPSSSRCSSSSLSTSTRPPSTWLSLKEGETQVCLLTHTQSISMYEGPTFTFSLLLCRFVGYPSNYGTLFGMRNEDVSLKFTTKCQKWRVLHMPAIVFSSLFFYSSMSKLPCLCVCVCLLTVLQCGPGGCLIELAEQLFIIMVGKQLINNIQEFIIPYVPHDWCTGPAFLRDQTSVCLFFYGKYLLIHK